MEVFLPDLESHELMYSLEKHFDDGPLIPALVVDADTYGASVAQAASRRGVADPTMPMLKPVSSYASRAVARRISGSAVTAASRNKAAAVKFATWMNTDPAATDLLIGDLFTDRVDQVWQPMESLYPPDKRLVVVDAPTEAP